MKFRLRFFSLFLSFLGSGCPAAPAATVERTILNGFHSFVKNKLGMLVLVSFWTPESVPRICKSVHLPIPRCLDDYLWNNPGRQVEDSFHFTFLFQNCLSYYRSWAFSYTLSNKLVYFYKTPGGDFGITWNLQISLEIGIFAMLSLRIPQTWRVSRLFRIL